LLTQFGDKHTYSGFILFYAMFQHGDTVGMLSLTFKRLTSRKQIEQGKVKDRNVKNT